MLILDIMKGIVFIVFIFFLGIVVALFGYGFLFNSNSDSIQNVTVSQTKNNLSDTKNLSKNTSVKNTGGLTLEEVAKHSTKEDCYLVINNKVYSVSSFIDSHPGGAKKIISNCGREVSGIFASIHSNKAWDLLKNYYLADLKI